MLADDYAVVIGADKTPAGQHKSQYNAPTIDEIAIVIVGEEFNSRDIVFHRRDGCGKVYIGETGRTIETRIKEHRRHYRLGQLEKSASAEHSILENYCIHWKEAGMLCKTHSGYWDRIIKEAIHIKITGKFSTGTTVSI
jgi:hypothetical protein